VVVRNGFLDLAPEPLEKSSAGGGRETLRSLCRTLSAPARFSLDSPGASRACFGASIGSNSDGKSVGHSVMPPTMPDFGARGDAEDSCRPDLRELGVSTYESALKFALAVPRGPGCGGRWSGEESRATNSDADASSSWSPAPSSLSPLLSSASSPPWSVQGSPLLFAMLPPLVLPEALPRMMLPPAGLWTYPSNSKAAPLPRRQLQQRDPVRRRLGKAPVLPRRSATASMNSSPQEAPEFMRGAFAAADPELCSVFSNAAPSEARSLRTARSAATGIHRVVWTVDAEKLRNHERQAVSPSFELPLDIPAIARLVIFPKPTAGSKGGVSFKKSRGWGGVHLKCEASAGSVVFCMSIGDGAAAPPRQLRGPVCHDFADHSTCGLPKDMEYWDFGKAVNKATQTFAVCLDILPCGGA